MVGMVLVGMDVADKVADSHSYNCYDSRSCDCPNYHSQSLGDTCLHMSSENVLEHYDCCNLTDLP